VAETCPACGAAANRARFTVRTTRQFVLEECGRCGLVFAGPRPSAEELEEFYVGGYFETGTGHGGGYTEYRSCGELFARTRWQALAHWLDLGRSPAQSVLDVGCATGGFLDEAQQHGWAATGVELSAEAAEIGRASFGLEIHAGDIFAPALDARRFGLITMWHVVEHVLDPAAFLARARSLLQPGGVLFIETPNWNSLGRVVRRSEWSVITPPEHINFFSTTSLTWLAEHSGLHVMRVATPANIFPSKRAGVRHVLNGAARVAGRLERGGNLRLAATSRTE
jgi:SAM-dependent methyltransferase